MEGCRFSGYTLCQNRGSDRGEHRKPAVVCAKIMAAGALSTGPSIEINIFNMYLLG